ncbi:MAG: hypothetical protein ACF8R7_09285 [Phycisphaerales bacterium JB039]
MTFACRLRRSPIGLDVGARRIKAAQVALRGASARLHAFLSIARLDTGPVLSPREAERLGAALFRAGFCGRAVAATTPAELLIDAAIELPPRSSRAPMAQIAAGELARVGRMPVESLVSAHWTTAPASSAAPAPARVVGAERARVDEFLDSVEAIDLGEGPLAPIALDTASWAMVRFVAPWLGAGHDVTLIADIGWRRCALVIVYGRRIVYERAVPAIGAESLRQAISRDLAAAPQVIERLLQRHDRDDGAAPPKPATTIAAAAIGRQAEQVTAEIERSLRFAAELGPTDACRVILAGGGAGPGLAREVAARLDGVAEVRRAEPGQLLDAVPDEAATDCALAAAIGLAMRMDR